ncbi:hypothetical protein DAPK24_040460, partial (mitochondrion) [Pichia kluyveri]
MSLVLRLELAAPGNQLLMGNHQLFNVIVTAHAVLMVFFLIMPVTMGFFGKEIKRMIMIDSNNYYKNKIPAQIVFNKKDLELAKYLYNLLKIGKIKELSSEHKYYPPILTHSVGQGELNESNSLELLNKKKIESILDNINYLPVLDIDKSEINTNGW